VEPAAHPLAKRIHDRVLQLIGPALINAELAEKLDFLGRNSEVVDALVELRSALDETVVELRSIMSELRTQATDETLKNRAA
jgi:signal transduction histidine kinase